MDNQTISKKEIFRYLIFSLIIVIFIYFLQTRTNNTKLVFCDVGQGDAIYLRIKNKIDVLIDAGPAKSVLNCLGRHMPFWDKRIEIVFLTHHDRDHYQGFFEIIKRYQINNFFTIYYRFDSQTYKKLERKIKNKKINYQYVYKNQKLSVLNSDFLLLWPPKNLKTYDSNDYSLIIFYKEGKNKVLFTGDSSLTSLSLVLKENFELIKNLKIMKIPHHGSKYSLNTQILKLADPEIVVISVGKNNSYGHPDKKVIDMFEALKIKIKRTDLDGEVVFSLK